MSQRDRTGEAFMKLIIQEQAEFIKNSCKAFLLKMNIKQYARHKKTNPV